jgi:pimeloyl-[acyl-carrier protein] methyl ester esterase
MVHVETHGRGRDLVLLHGWGVQRAVWNDLASALANRYRVHCVDLPGYGLSAPCMPYTLDDMVDRLASALPGGLAICGWSLGGQLALRWARRAPHQVEHLVLIATTPRFVRDADWKHGIEADVLDRFACELERDPLVALNRFAALQAQDDSHANVINRRLRQCVAAACEPTILAAGLALLKHTDLRSEIGDIAQPALVVHGANDAVTPRGAGAWLAATMPAARWIELAATGHAPFISEPLTFASYVSEFCNG